jgi:hypothetical protein
MTRYAHVHLSQYLAQLFLDEIYYRQVCIQNQNTFYVQYILPPPPLKSCRLFDNVGKYCTVRQATDGKLIWSMHFASWISKARIQTH